MTVGFPKMGKDTAGRYFGLGSLSNSLEECSEEGFYFLLWYEPGLGTATDGRGGGIFQNGNGKLRWRYFRVRFSVNSLEKQARKAFASCCGVNLAVSLSSWAVRSPLLW